MTSASGQRPTFDLTTDTGRASCFGHDVERGGFAQLLFNLQGEHLESFAGMLERAGADVAARFYERAVLICLGDEPAYQAFLAGDYVTDNAVKFALQSLSVEYFRSGVPFEREAAAWRASIGAGRGLLVGVNGGGSGSSSTYAHLGEVRDQWRSRSAECLGTTLPASPPRHPPVGPLQASLRRLGRDAGILGARFTPDVASNAIEVRIAFGPSDRARDDPYLQELERDDAQAVLDEIATQSRGAAYADLGPGRLDVGWAVGHPIDGSRRGLQRLIASLVPLLTLPVDATETTIRLAWRRQSESVRIAQLGASLVGALTGRPERGAFGHGASDGQLDALEATLGLTLPEAVRGLLRQFDGASTVDARPTPDEDVSAPACEHCDLLSTDQIRDACFDLLSINDASIAVDAWDGRRPINPRLRLPDDTLVPWPYLPVARTRGRELLVLELSGAGRILDAWHEHGPSQWRPLYERYVDFIDAYLVQGGCINAIAKAGHRTQAASN